MAGAPPTYGARDDQEPLLVSEDGLGVLGEVRVSLRRFHGHGRRGQLLHCVEEGAPLHRPVQRHVHTRVRVTLKDRERERERERKGKARRGETAPVRTRARQREARGEGASRLGCWAESKTHLFVLVLGAHVHNDGFVLLAHLERFFHGDGLEASTGERDVHGRPDGVRLARLGRDLSEPAFLPLRKRLASLVAHPTQIRRVPEEARVLTLALSARLWALRLHVFASLRRSRGRHLPPRLRPNSSGPGCCRRAERVGGRATAAGGPRLHLARARPATPRRERQRLNHRVRARVRLSSWSRYATWCATPLKDLFGLSLSIRSASM